MLHKFVWVGTKLINVGHLVAIYVASNQVQLSNGDVFYVPPNDIEDLVKVLTLGDLVVG